MGTWCRATVPDWRLQWVSSSFTLYTQYNLSKFQSLDNWQWEANPFEKLPYGKWEIRVPPRDDGSCAIHHLSEVKIIVRNKSGHLLDRLSPWAKYVVQPKKEANQGTNFKQRIWHPPPHDKYMFRYPRPQKPKSLRIYECHVGIATQDQGVGSYKNFADNIIPRIVKQGYNAIQVQNKLIWKYDL